METYKTDNTPNEVINDQNSENDKNLKELTLDLQKVKISIESEVNTMMITVGDGGLKLQ